jgi:hypothetical protein
MPGWATHPLKRSAHVTAAGCVPKATAGERKAIKKGASKRLTRQQRAELKSLAALNDKTIDTADAPELPDWSDAKRGPFYQPIVRGQASRARRSRT